MYIGLEILEGTESLVWRELDKILGPRKVTKAFQNLILIATDDMTRDVVLISLFSRAITNVYVVPHYGRYNTTNELYKISMTIPWHEIFEPDKSFAVTTKILPQKLDRKTIGRLVGQGVVDRFKAEIGSRPPVNLKSPDIEITSFINECYVAFGIKLFDKNMNSPEEISNRLVILGLESYRVSSVGEIYHTGVCESAFEFFNLEPLKDRLLESIFIELKIIDKEKILKLATQKWKRKSANITCFVENFDPKYKPAYGEINQHLISEIPTTPIDTFLTNLVLAFPSKKSQQAAVSKIQEYLAQNNQWTQTSLLIRSDIKINTIFKAKKLVEISVKGIPSQLLLITRR